MSSPKPLVYPPLDGSLLLPEAIDFNAEHNPDVPVFVYAKDDGSDDIVEISQLEFSRACHRVAHSLRPDREGIDAQVVAVIAVVDTILYQAIVVGIMRAGLVPFPISPRNSPAAVVNLLQKSGCHRIIATRTHIQPLLDGVKAQLENGTEIYPLVVDEAPAFSEIYPKLGVETPEDPFVPFSQYATRPSLKDVAIYLHSSGSTGLPKAIGEPHTALLHYILFPSLSDIRTHQPELRMGVMALPPFHTLGVHCQILNTIYGLKSVSVYPPTAWQSETAMPFIPTPDNILDHTRRTKSNCLMIIPSLLQIWAQDPKAIDFLKTLIVVGYSGGSMAPKIGDKLQQSGVMLCPIYGGTEFGAPTPMIPDPKDVANGDWAYTRFSPRATINWEPQGDGTYELQFLLTDTHCVSAINMPDGTGYATSDLFERHPTKPDLWRIVGRVDDVLIHSSGEKTVPGPMEDIINASPIVQGTVMFGRARSEVGILIEPRPNYAIDINDQAKLADLRNQLWPIIEEANQNAPAFSRIFKEMILITSTQKPLARTGKGTVMRKLALKQYEQEIDDLYDTIESSTKAADAVVPPKHWSESEAEAWLIQQTSDIHNGKNVSTTVDLFEQGFDSLTATFLRHRILGALRASVDPAAQKASQRVSQSIVYEHPTIQQLATFIAELVRNPDAVTRADGRIAIENMIEKYSSHLPIVPDTTVNGHLETNTVVLLTGSTGSLGSHLLDSLLQHHHVDRVYALNRPSQQSMLQRHQGQFKEQGLDVSLLESPKLVFVEGNVDKEKLGLPGAIYEEIHRSTTLLIHNAWVLDFNLSLPSFEGMIKGTRNLIDFAATGPFASTIRFLFTSSISAAQSWDKSKGPFPEDVLPDSRVALGGGYGESKYVAERLLVKSGLKSTIFRIGQICGGSPNGAWASTDWFPILVKSSLVLGALPQAQGVVSWLPMHSVSQAILDVAFATEAPPQAVNLVHPRAVQWDAIILPLKDTLSKQGITSELPVIPFDEWFSRLEKAASQATEDNLKALPAIKLLEFFRVLSKADTDIRTSGKTDVESGGMTSFRTDKAQSVSSTMAKLEPIGSADAEGWVKYWNSIGMFDGAHSSKL